MAFVLIKKGAAKTRRELSSGAQGQNRRTSLRDEYGMPWKPNAIELQHLKPEEILRKIPISQRQSGSAVIESAIGRALARMGYPIEPEYPVNDGRNVGAVEQRMAENVTHGSPRLADVLDLMNDRMRAKMKRKGGEHENLSQLLQIIDLHAGNVGEFAEGSETTPVSEDMRLPFMPENIRPGERMNKVGRDEALFDSEGALRSKPRKRGIMRTLDPMYNRLGISGPNLEHLFNDAEGPDGRIPYQEWKDWDDDDIVDGSSDFDTWKRNEHAKSGRISSIRQDLLHLLSGTGAKELPEFRDKLPPLSDYDAWAPSQKDMEKISSLNLPDLSDIPEGYETPYLQLNEEGRDIKEQLEAHSRARSRYKKFLDTIKLVSGIAEDPDQMRLFEFSNPASAKLGEKLREKAKEGLRRNTESSYEEGILEDGEFPTTLYGDPWVHPLLNDNEEVRQNRLLAELGHSITESKDPFKAIRFGSGDTNATEPATPLQAVARRTTPERNLGSFDTIPYLSQGLTERRGWDAIGTANTSDWANLGTLVPKGPTDAKDSKFTDSIWSLN